MILRLKYDLVNYRDLVTISLFFALPLFHKFSNLLIVVSLLLSLIVIWKKGEIPKIDLHWFLPTLFLYFIISELFSGGTWSSIEKRLLLLIVPILFAINTYALKSNLRNKIYVSYILGNCIAMVICIGRAIVKSTRIDEGQWSFNPKIIQDTPYDFLTSAVMGGNYFFSEDFSYFQHPTYASIYIVFAQYLIFEVFSSSSRRKIKWLLFACYIFFLFSIFLLSSKAGLISSILISFWILFKMQTQRVVTTLIISVFLIIAILLLYINPRTKEFNNTFRTNELINPNAQYGYDLRILSWDASLSLIKDNWLIGVGESNKRTALVGVYRNKGYVVPTEEEFNSHNQYLDFLIGGGLIGFSLFITGLLQLFWIGLKDKDYILLAFLIIFSFNSLFENLLSRHSGILFFSIFVSLVVANRKIKAFGT